MAEAVPFVFILGLIIGSFLNVVALRWDTGSSISGRSKCPHCGKKLSWYELVPVLSFIFLRGKCFSCKKPISLQYPLIEIFTGLVFATLYPAFGLTTYYLLLTTVFSIYIVILIYDFHHKIIPDALVYSAIALSFLYALLNLQTYQFIDLLAGPLIFLFFALIWLFSRGRAMGFGDAKLGLSIGWLLGAETGFSAIILSFWIGAGIMLLIMLFSRFSGLFNASKKLTMKSEIPFAPFMILGAWISLIYDLNLFIIMQ